ncbi:Uncharacterised protein [Serratia entomophila]|uniref:Afp18 n=1 Tax=Serratia entomophila TaxID=42906 RepID=Q6HAC1_9GAMM|nr:hypothetical protein [Serratia entomophila]AAT48355.1 Afp18 [Serratia entomophila]UIW20914.1 hypothetical protein KHA73_24130 [Serratia entomophila]ULG11177.1 Afp18 [Serratia entomophila]ULG11497.1 Afp18 [Serratia entomophila]ULG12287.1 Afp18 [Serratia entomophila]
MPYSSESKEKETHSKETERDNADPVFQRVSQGGVGVSPPDEGGDLSAGSNNDHLFAFIRETHLEEAQEFRLKGYNSQVPEVDEGLLTQLRDDLAAAKSRQYVQASVGGPLGSRWLLEQIGKIERLTDKFSDEVIKRWVKHELPRKNVGEAAGTELGSRRRAQSLARRLESTMQTLIRVVHTLHAMDDYSTPEKRHDMLVAELTGAFSSSDKNTVIQALGRMTAETSGHAAWASLMQARTAAWEAGKSATVDAMIATSQHEAEKANKKARELQGDSQAFFSHVAAYLQSLSSDLAKVSINMGQSTSSSTIRNEAEKASELQGDSQTFVSHVAAYLQSLPSDLAKVPINMWQNMDFVKTKLQAQTAVAGMKVHAHRLVRIAQHGHSTKTPAKDPEQVVTDSIIRSILWLWQQPAIKIQCASTALLSKVGELKKIEGILASYAVTDELGNEQERRNPPGEEDLDAQLREWVSASLKQENPENQRAVKVVTLERLLGGDIASARNLVERLGKAEEGIQNLLRRQQVAVLKMSVERLPAAVSSLKAVDKLLPDLAGDLTASIAALSNALQAAEYPARDFSEAKIQAGYAQLWATKVKESLSAASARLTERPLDEHSRGARLAKHWANLAKERSVGNYPPPDAQQVLASLKEQGLLAGTLSTGDPAGYLFATRLAGELENAGNGELRLPMSPEQYVALEKGLVEYIVKWGQRRISQGVTRIVIELSFEQALDTVSFNVSKLFRLPYKVLKASIKIPYNVNKVNNYTMPGHDKPYKAIYGLLGKKLKQLGFNLLTAPVPGVMKLVAGTGITAGAGVHNLRVENREKTFSAVYQHVVEGKQSEKIKMDSVKSMIFDSVLDTATTAAFKGGRRAWQSGRNKNDIEINEVTLSQAQQRQVAANNVDTAWGNAAANERKVEPVSHSSPLQQQTDVRPFSDKSDQDAAQPRVRKRAVADMAPPPPHQWHNNIPANTTLQSEHFDFDRDIRYQGFSDEKKKQTYLHGIQLVLLQIQNDGRFAQKIRNNAYLASIGVSNLVPVDIEGYKLKNTFLLPDSPSAKSGVIVRLDSENPYYYVGKGSDLLEDIKWAMPHDANEQKYEYMPDSDGNAHFYRLRNGFDIFNDIRMGNSSFEYFFNYNNPEPISITRLSSYLANTIEGDYKNGSSPPKNKLLISRAITGAHIPDPGVTATAAGYHIEFTWDNLTSAEYLRSFSRPFSTLSGEMQLVSSSINGETIQETELHVHQAEYIGSWVDATVGAITSFTPEGWVLNTTLSAADIAADLTEDKDPDPMAVAGLVVGCIPGGRIAAKVGKFTRIGGKVVKYGLMLGNKAVDLAIVGKSVKIAVDTGDPLAIYKALLISGIGTTNSYDMAKNMSSKLKISKKLEDSVQLDKPLQNLRGGSKRPEEGESTSQKRSQPDESPENSQEAVYSGPSGRARVTFDQTTEHHIMLNRFSRLVLARSFAEKRIQSFEHSSSKFKSSDEFKVDKSIPLDAQNASLNDMASKTDNLINQLEQFTGDKKESISANLKNIQLMIGDIMENRNNRNDNLNFHTYVLVGKNTTYDEISNYYGFAEFKFSINNGNLTLNNLIGHPYVVINKYPEFRDYLIRNGVITQPELEPYNIKNVARYLGSKAVSSEIGYYESIPATKVKILSFTGANPITQKLGNTLQSISDLFSKKRFSDEPNDAITQDELFTRQTDLYTYDEMINHLKTIVRTTFTPVKPIEEISSEKTDAAIKGIMTNGDAEIISENIIESKNSLDHDTSYFSHEVISAVDRAYEKVNSVKSLFERAESQPEIKSQLKSLINEATGLNDEVIIDIDKVDVSSISDMAYNRFKDNINTLHDYLSKQKSGGYTSFVLFKYRQFNPSKPDAFAMPYDSKKRIFLAMLPENQRHGGLVDTVTHEASHNSSYTLDHTYIGNARSNTGSFPSSFEPPTRDSRYFYENERVGKLSAKYALDLPENANITQNQLAQADILLRNSRLTKADTLLNAAEYNAYMIDVLSRVKINGSHIEFEENSSRSKRSVSGGNHKLDDIIILASMNATLPRREGGEFESSTFKKTLTEFINKGTTSSQVDPVYASYLPAFNTIVDSEGITLQQVKDLKSALPATGNDLRAQARYNYAVLQYLSGSAGIKLPIDTDVIRNSINDDLNIASCVDNCKKAASQRLELLKAVPEYLSGPEAIHAQIDTNLMINRIKNTLKHENYTYDLKVNERDYLLLQLEQKYIASSKPPKVGAQKWSADINKEINYLCDEIEEKKREVVCWENKKNESSRRLDLWSTATKYLSDPKGIKPPIDTDVILNNINDVLNHAGYVYNYKVREKDNLEKKLSRTPLTSQIEVNRLQTEIAKRYRLIDYWGKKADETLLMFILWRNVFG